jgi:hypothetical protein
MSDHEDHTQHSDMQKPSPQPNSGNQPNPKQQAPGGQPKNPEPAKHDH